MKNIVSVLLFCLLAIGTLQAQCPEGQVILQSQSGVNNFLAEYPNCTEIDELWIMHPANGPENIPLNLEGFENIVSINSLQIVHNITGPVEECFSFEHFSSLAQVGKLISNTSICNFQGLEALEYVGQFAVAAPNIDPFLEGEYVEPELSLSFAGLESLQHIDTLALGYYELINLDELSDVQINKHLGLTSCTGFSSLSDFNLQNSASLFLESLPEISSINGIENITSLKYLVLDGLPNLNNMDALLNLQHIGDSLVLQSTGVQELSAFQSLELIGGYVSILDNSSLSVCSFEYLCEHPEVLGTVENNASGCNSIVEIAENCDVSTVNGKVYADLNCNGIQDGDEPVIANSFVYRNSGDPFTTTNSSGLYSGYLAPEQSFEITASPNLIGFTSSIEDIATTSEFQNFDNTDIALCPLGDFANLYVGLSPYGGSPQPGFDNTYQVCVTNNGSVTVDASVSIDLSLASDITISDADGGIIDGPTITWIAESLAPFQSECFTVTINSSAETPLGTNYTIIFEGSVVNSDTPEIDPSDNTHVFEDVVVGSYDPNDKNVNNEVVNMENVAPDSALTLEYLIRFQNTGTAPATFIRVIDLLPPQLDVTTLEMINASHDYVLTHDAPNKLDWFFDDINLPDSTSNEPESHGFIHFRINTYQGMEVGDIIENYASIYFDYNAPIITEDAVTSFMICPIVEIVFEIDQMSVPTQADSYQWYYNGELIEGATDQWMIPFGDGIYSVQVTWEDGCIETSSYTYGNVSVSEFNDKQIKLVPNPAKETTSVLFPTGNWQVSLWDIHGALMKSTEKVYGNRAQIDVSALSSGVYFVQVFSDKNMIVKKLVVE